MTMSQLTLDNPESVGLPEPLARRSVRVNAVLPPITPATLAIIALFAIIWIVVGSQSVGLNGPWRDLWQGALSWNNATASANGGVAVGASAIQHSVYGQRALLGIHQLGGLEAIVLLRSLLAIGGYILLTLACKARCGSWICAAICTATAFLISLPYVADLGTRQLGIICLAALLLILSAARRHWWLAYAMLPLLALWSNLDSTFILGIVVAWLGTAERLHHVARTGGPQGSRFCHALVATGLATAAALCNPLGWNAYPQALSNLGLSWPQDALRHAPLQIQSAAGLAFGASLILLLIAAHWSPRRASWPRLLVLGIIAIATVWSSDLLLVWALIAACQLSTYLVDWFPSIADHKWSQRESARGTHTATAVLAVYAALVWTPASQSWITGNYRQPAEIVSGDVPVYLGDELSRWNVKGHVYMPLKWADYLVFRSGGQAIPLGAPLDGSVPHGARRDQNALSQAVSGWREIARHYQVHYMIACKTEERLLATLVRSEPDCRLEYEDQMCVLSELPGLEIRHDPQERVNSLKSGDSINAATVQESQQ